MLPLVSTGEVEYPLHDFSYEVNGHGHVMEVMTERATGRRRCESMVYGLDTDEPYTKWMGERFYLPEDGVIKAREAKRAYQDWRAGYGTDPRGRSWS